MKKRIPFFLITLLLIMTNCEEQKRLGSTNILAVYFDSEYLQKQSYFIVYEPVKVSEPIPVLYLLNGWGASSDAWGSGADLYSAASDYNMIIVSLTAGENAYVDVQNDSTRWYMSYCLEIVAMVDSMYNTIPSRYGRALCGISNGGAGAIYIASHNPDIFCSTSSLSGGLYDAPYFLDYFNFDEMSILLDIGSEDGMLSEMQFLHNELIKHSINHEYNVTTGGHNWQFWQEHYEEHIQFHYNNFNEE